MFFRDFSIFDIGQSWMIFFQITKLGQVIQVFIHRFVKLRSFKFKWGFVRNWSIPLSLTFFILFYTILSIKTTIYMFEEVVKGKSYTTIMTLVEKRCLLAIYESSSFILMFSGIPTNGATKVP